MFKRHKTIPSIDKTQLELIQNAQRRVRQKKRLFIHTVLFLLSAVFMYVANMVLGIGMAYKIQGLDWYILVIFGWSFLFLYHVISVFVTNKFMGNAWKKAQLDKLVNQQKVRIEALKKQLALEEVRIAETQLYNESLEAKKTINLPKSTLKTLIVAAGEDNAIGKDNNLIWHLSKDLKRFKQLTSGHYIIMGRKTFESLPKPLPNRKHIVITKQQNYIAPEGVVVVHSLEEAFKATDNDKQSFVIGGGDIYKQALPYVDQLEVTRVHASFKDADTFFPPLDTSQWREVHRETYEADDTHRYSFSFITYVRIS